jgi:hypothetical protein
MRGNASGCIATSCFNAASVFSPAKETPWLIYYDFLGCARILDKKIEKK